MDTPDRKNLWAAEAARRPWSIFQSKDDTESDFRFQYKMILKI
jgi:hypothetical protein